MFALGLSDAGDGGQHVTFAIEGRSREAGPRPISKLESGPFVDTPSTFPHLKGTPPSDVSAGLPAPPDLASGVMGGALWISVEAVPLASWAVMLASQVENTVEPSFLQADVPGCFWEGGTSPLHPETRGPQPTCPSLNFHPNPFFLHWKLYYIYIYFFF